MFKSRESGGGSRDCVEEACRRAAWDLSPQHTQDLIRQAEQAFSVTAGTPSVP
jgi:hypothetical protein